MAERAAQREEVLAVVTAALATDTAKSWEARLRPLGIPAAAVRSLPDALEATPEVVVTAGSSAWWAARFTSQASSPSTDRRRDWTSTVRITRTRPSPTPCPAHPDR